ncbi:hypothetical protein Sjap_005104 [Stephania japonica]|uniref:Uncharacterized protein n=1 Tax=Stephania japonica TaxID=461633 RepID=A0AAP0K3C2_9MAGN
MRELCSIYRQFTECGIGNREVAEDALGSRSCHTGRDSSALQISAVVRVWTADRGRSSLAVP